MTVELQFVREDPIRGGRVFKLGGVLVHAYLGWGHLWREADDTCAACGVTKRRCTDPSWARCPERR